MGCEIGELMALELPWQAGRQVGGQRARTRRGRKEGVWEEQEGAGARRIYQGAKADPS